MIARGVARRALGAGLVGGLFAGLLSPVAATVRVPAAAAAPVRAASLSSPPLAARPKVVPTGDFHYAPALGADRVAPVKPVTAGPHGDPNATVLGRTATSTTYLNPDGTRSLAVSAGTVNFQDSSGAWHPFNTLLTQTAGGRLSETSGAFSAGAALRTDGSDDVLQASGPGWSAGLGLVGAAAGVLGAVSGSTVTYAGVQPGVDLALDFGRFGVEGALVVHQPSTTGTWDLALGLQGASLAAQPDGTVGLSVAGKVVGVLAGGIAQDSASPSAATPVTLSVVSPSVVRVAVSPAWLNDPSRVFPVTVDPSLTVTSTTSGDDDAYVQQNNPTTNYNGGAQYDSSVGAYVDLVGYPSYPSVQAYSFQHFNLSSLAGDQILGAQWQDWLYADSATNAPFTLWAAANPWSASSVTWNSLPGHYSTPRINAAAGSTGTWSYVGGGVRGSV